MKKILFVCIAAASLMSCQSKDKKNPKALSTEEREKALKDTANYTTIEWLDSTTHDLGKLKKGEQIEVTFRFKNTGNKNLVFEDISAPCSCTLPEKPVEAYPPGAEGLIKAKFNGSGQGMISKHINVVANTKPLYQFELTFTGEIKE